VNASLQVGERKLQPREIAEMFGRPFMGGLERLGVIATGTPAEIRKEVEAVLAEAPERFILGADCTVPADTPWENLKAAIETAHAYRS
jgi:uroporphyrinogen decarboxylase